MKSSKIAIVLGLLMINIPNPVISQTDMKSSKTICTVKMTGRNAGCKLRINDLPVLSNDDPGTISKFLINPWLINGRNTFKILMLPPDSATKNHPQFVLTEMSCKATFSLSKDWGMPDSTVAEVGVTASDADPTPAKTGEFSVALGYSQPPWAQSEKIGSDSMTRRKILARYREFYRLLETKDLDGIMTFSAEKFKGYSRSTFDPAFESDKRASFKEEFSTPPGYLISIDEQEKFGLRYEYFYGDRLVSINNDEDRSIIQYYDDNDGVTTQYRLYFYFDGKDFILIL